jgi:hypothetical protein
VNGDCEDEVKEDTNSRSKRGSQKSTQDAKNADEVVMDSQVSSSQGEEVPVAFKKPLEKKNCSRKSDSNGKDLYKDFDFSGPCNEENSSQKDDSVVDSSQDEFSARIARISGKKNVPEKAPKFFKARAKERLNSSQKDANKFEFDSNAQETGTKAKPAGRKGKGKKIQKPGMNFMSYLEFKKPRDYSSSQSAVVEKGERQTYKFPSPKKDVDKAKNSKAKQNTKYEKDNKFTLEFPCDKVKKNQRKLSNSSPSGEEPDKSVSPVNKKPKVKKGRKSLQNKQEKTDEEEVCESLIVPSPPAANHTSSHRRRKQTEAEMDSPNLDLTDARQDTRQGKKSMQKKSKKSDNEDDWEFPTVTSPPAQKSKSRRRSKWEFPAPASSPTKNNASQKRSRSKKRGTETSTDSDLTDAFQNTIAKIKKKVKDATPKECKEEEFAALSQGSRPDYDLASIRDSTDDEEMGGALLHYDSKAEVKWITVRSLIFAGILFRVFVILCRCNSLEFMFLGGL